LLAADPPIGLDLSFRVGPIATQLAITQPVAQSVTTPTGGSAVVYRSTLHLHAQDNTQTPPFTGDLVAIGAAADPDTLVGGFLPAAIRIMQDRQAGMTFQQAAADAQAKTGVTVTFLQDAALIEYALLIGAIAFLSTVFLQSVATPPFGNQLSAIQSKMAAAMAAIGITVPTCSPSTTSIP
jgi:hypothetical protein